MSEETMVTPMCGEPRQHYLLRVVLAFLDENPVQDYTVNYDGTTCDGLCLREDIKIALSMGCTEP
jgi:hypothetical protein